MNLDQLSKQGGMLKLLLEQSRRWLVLDRKVKGVLPVNLHAHVQTACIDRGRLVLLAANNMAASRLKMILPQISPRLCALDEEIAEVAVKVVPKVPEPPKSNSLKLSPAALMHFDEAASRLQNKHPELAEALADLVGKHHFERK